MSLQLTFWDTPNATSSQASEAGPTPSGSQDGPKIVPCGPAPAPVSPSAPQGNKKAKRTPATSGPSSSASSPSARLQLFLESRLRQLLDGRGSPEYVLTWKHWDMESGPPICALRASARRTSGKGFGGWATPSATTWGGSAEAHLERKRKARAAGKSMGLVVSCLDQQAQLAGWPTPDASIAQDGEPLESWLARRELLKAKKKNGNGCGTPLTMAAQMAGWVTPSSRDWKDTPGMATTGTNPDGSTRTRIDQLPRQAAGAIPTSSPAPTEKRGALNPAFSRWLMGFQTAWDNCAPTVTQSSRKSRRNSSKPSS